jgi:heme/copper-type cytochrome/quinol oxidase subunit 2
MRDILQVFKAVASAMVGVGKRDSLAKDFEKTEKQGPWAYIIVALIMVAIFIGVIITAVRFALS